MLTKEALVECYLSEFVFLVGEPAFETNRRSVDLVEFIKQRMLRRNALTKPRTGDADQEASARILIKDLEESLI